MSTPDQRAEWKADSKRIIGFEIGDKVKFNDTTEFTCWSMCTEDPLNYLNSKDIYTIEDIDIRSMSSGIKLEGYKHWFNPTQFYKVIKEPTMHILKERIKIYDEQRNIVTIGIMVAKVISKFDNPFASDFVAIGMSLCHKNDKYDKKQAELIAIDRADNYTKKYRFKNRIIYNGSRSDFPFFKEPISIAGQLRKFISRCQRYYKDKNIILPKIDFF